MMFRKACMLKKTSLSKDNQPRTVVVVVILF